MSQSKTDRIIDILVEKTSHTRDQITKMIQDEITKMDGLVNEEGAAYVLANNLGISIDTSSNVELLTIDMLSPGQSGLTIIGRLSRVYSTRTFTRKDGNTGRVRNIEIIDQTGSVRVALWDDQTQTIEKEEIDKGDLIKISGADARMGYKDKIELSLGRQGSIVKVNDSEHEATIPQVSTAAMTSLSALKAVDDGTDVSVKGKIVFKRDSPTTFDRKDGSEGRVSSIRIADGTDQTRITFWDTAIAKIEELQTNDIVKVTDVNVGSSEYGKELTFRDYSTINPIEDEELAKVEVASGSSREVTELDNLNQVEDNMRGITVTGQIISIGQLNSFERDGETNYVGNLTIRDPTAKIRVTLWRDQAKKLESYSIGDVIRIENASAKLSDYSQQVELSVNDYSTIVDITDEVDLDTYEQEPEFVHLSDVTETRSGVSIKVRLNRFFDVNVITRDDGSESRVQNVSVYDPPGQQARIAAWDENIDKITQYNEGEYLALYDVTIKPAGEYQASININQYTTIKPIDEDDFLPAFQSASSYQNNPTIAQKTTLDSLAEGSRVEVQATIVNAYPPSFYPGCNQCRSKVDTTEVDEMGVCPKHGEVEKRLIMILTMEIDDRTDTVKIKLFDEVAEKFLEMSADEAQDMIKRLSDDKAPIKKQKLEMMDVVVKGKVTHDNYSDELQINVNEIAPVDITKETDEFLNRL